MKSLLILLVVFFPLNCFSQEIAIVDIDYLFKNSNEGKSIQKKYDKLEKDKLNFFKKKEKVLKEKEKSILAKKNILSAADFEKEIKNFQVDVKKYNDEKRNEIKSIRDKKSGAYLKLYEKINLILVEYSKKNNLSTVIDKKYIVITKSEIDITKKVLELLK